MEPTSVTGIITSILTFLGGSGFIKLVDFIRNRTNKKYLEKLTTNLQDLSKIFRIIERILNQSGAHRVLILKASNGGGIPKPGSEMFIKLLYAATEEEEPNIYEKYNSIKVDGQYVEMLINIQKNGMVIEKVSEMPNSLLKRIYQSEEINYAEFYFLGNTATELYFCTVNSKNEEDFSQPSKRVAIELGINDLRKIFDRYMSQ